MASNNQEQSIKEIVKKALSAYDVDQTGFLDPDELKKLIQHDVDPFLVYDEISDVQFDAAVKHINPEDINGDGKLDLEQAYQVMALCLDIESDS